MRKSRWRINAQPTRRIRPWLQPQLAATLSRLVEAGLENFHRGDIVRTLADGLSSALIGVWVKPMNEAFGSAPRRYLTKP